MEGGLLLRRDILQLEGVRAAVGVLPIIGRCVLPRPPHLLPERDGVLLRRMVLQQPRRRVELCTARTRLILVLSDHE